MFVDFLLINICCYFMAVANGSEQAPQIEIQTTSNTGANTALAAKKKDIRTSSTGSSVGRVWIDYCDGVLDVFVNSSGGSKPAVPDLSHNIDLNAFFTSSDVYMGFTAGTQSQDDNHDIMSWEFTDGCIGDPDVDGDPHFLTWNNTFYDFMGKLSLVSTNPISFQFPPLPSELILLSFHITALLFFFPGACDLKLITAPYFAPDLTLDIDVRTTIRYGYSYVESAAVRIGDSILEVSSFGQYLLDGVSAAKLPAVMAGLFTVEHTQPSDKVHKFEIHLDEEEGDDGKNGDACGVAGVELAEVGKTIF